MTWLRTNWFVLAVCSMVGVMLGAVTFWLFWVTFSAPYGGRAAITWQAAVVMLLLLLLILVVVRLGIVTGTLTLSVHALERTRMQSNRELRDLRERIEALERTHPDKQFRPHLHEGDQP